MEYVDQGAGTQTGAMRERYDDLMKLLDDIGDKVDSSREIRKQMEEFQRRHYMTPDELNDVVI